MIKLELTLAQAQQLAKVLDVAVRAGGMEVANAAVPLANILVFYTDKAVKEGAIVLPGAAPEVTKEAAKPKRQPAKKENGE